MYSLSDLSLVLAFREFLTLEMQNQKFELTQAFL